MKDVHPKYYEKTTVSCACGNSFETGSTEENIQVEVCAACHPFYTGKQKLVDVAGRVDKFKKRLVDAEAKQQSKKPAARARKKSEEKTVKIS